MTAQPYLLVAEAAMTFNGVNAAANQVLNRIMYDPAPSAPYTVFTPPAGTKLVIDPGSTAIGTILTS